MDTLFEPEIPFGQYKGPTSGRHNAEHRYNQSEANDRRDNAIQHVADNADHAQKERAFQALVRVAESEPELFVDDVQKEFNEVFTGDPRAMGHIMRRGVRDGIIEKTGEVKNSARVTCNSNPRATYRSLIYKGGAA